MPVSGLFLVIIIGLVWYLTLPKLDAPDRQAANG